MPKYMFFIIMMLLVSCEKDGASEDTLKLQAYEDSFANIVRGELDDFTYFNLSDNDTVNIQDPSTSSDWDLGFGQISVGTRPDGQGGFVPIIQSAIITNGGVSGPAQGKGYLLKDTLFSDVTHISDDVMDSLRTDREVNDILSPAIETGSGTWYNYDPQTHQLSPNPSHVILVKTADGRYAKVQVVELYYQSSPTAAPDYTKFGYFTIKYVLQEDASSTQLVPTE